MMFDMKEGSANAIPEKNEVFAIVVTCRRGVVIARYIGIAMCKRANGIPERFILFDML